MAMNDDHYSTLGVSKNASTAEIKQAYRKLAAQHHPDRGGDTAKFQSIQQAYDILGDPEKRQQYDNPPPPHMGGMPFGNPFGNFGSPFGDPFQDLINQFTRQTRQQIFTLTVMVTLEQIAQGGTENVQINTPQGPKVIQLQIPRGIDEHQQIRYENIIPGAFLQVNFRTHRHPKFERSNLDLQHIENVNMLKLITGTNLVVTDIFNNKFDMNLPPMTKPGTKFRLQGRGLSTQHQTGDHYVLIQAELPDKISEELQTLIKKELQH